MPFVPLGSRKNLGLIEDHHKEKIRNDMHTKDFATVKLHHQLMPGTSGYRYANHPQCVTIGNVRSEAPFKAANKPWAPPEHEPNGMAAMRDLEQAPIGAFLEGSHSKLAENLRRTRSVPAMVKTLAANPDAGIGEVKGLGAQAREMANPVSIELARWKRMAKVTERDLSSMPQLPPKKEKAPPSKPVLVTGGLVNFPKYMLFENSHMKTVDFQRFVAAEDQNRKEAEDRQARQAAVEEAMARGEVQDTPISPVSTSRDPLSGTSQSTKLGLGEVSWGAPRLRGADFKINPPFAGSSMPHGRACRSSNPFRMG
jgi:hypothetical protein